MATDGAFIDLTKVVQKQHEIADKAKQPCSGIVYVHKREDCAYLAARISKVRFNFGPVHNSCTLNLKSLFPMYIR